jgi:hypothetical protein
VTTSAGRGATSHWSRGRFEIRRSKVGLGWTVSVYDSLTRHFVLECGWRLTRRWTDRLAARTMARAERRYREPR